MQKFTLELLFHIIGIGSASGLFFNGDSLFLISDNSNVLYGYKMNEKKLEKIALTTATDKPIENIAKKDKPDFEALSAKDGKLYLFGSGSTENRNHIAVVNIQAKTLGTPIDATDLYMVLQNFAEIGPEDFNIEAAVNDGSTWYLFNRGNGPAGQNGIFTLDGDITDAAFQVLYNAIELPAINGAATSFTDAVVVKKKLYFLAAAEKSNSTYHDGEVAGTIVGRIDIETMEIDFTETISLKNKFEGITLYKNNTKSLEFLLCEDTDNDSTTSGIYKLTLKK